MDRPHYWPEAKEIHLKLVYEASSCRVLGLQAAGPGEVAKRVDTATQLIAREATVDDFVHLEHAYAPPYAPAMEPLAVVAMAAQNEEDGIASVSPGVPWEGSAVLDVRSRQEVENEPASHDRLTHIPLDELAGRLGELEDSVCCVVCERGTRSAEAVRLLLRHGIRARYLGGGLHWRGSMDKAGESRCAGRVAGS